MAMTTAQRTAKQHLDAQRAAESAAAGLKEALARVGVLFPSLRASEPVSGTAFLELGGLNAGVAIRLAEILTTAADELPALRATEQ